jgi:hypothetical protein
MATASDAPARAARMTGRRLLLMIVCLLVVALMG